ncbi:MAG: methyltransferase domain-containing protein [Chloroflexota bacterium]|nr:methyltransferase domain-containing protein [Chloroflexota bacterium]
MTGTSQFEHPRGPLGRVAGWLMSRTNGGINRFALDALAALPGDAVLEIGFGPGETLRTLAARPGGFTAGIDPSETMVDAAAARSRALIESGRLEVGSGAVSRIPYQDARFDRAFSVNTIYFWPSPEQDLREVARVLRPGGRLVLAFRVRQDGTGEAAVPMVRGDASRLPLSTLRAWLEGAGFRKVEVNRRKFRVFDAAVVGATKA